MSGAIVGILGSAISGGLLGTVGAVFGKWFEGRNELKRLAMMNEHDLGMAREEREMAQLQLQASQALATTEANARVSVADLAALEASLEADKATYSGGAQSKWLVAVDVVRGFMRPLITAWLVAFTTGLALYLLAREDAPALNTEQQVALLLTLIDSAVTLVGIAVPWWFGSRSHKKS